MLNAEKRKQLTDLMQKHFTDLDIESDEPFKFRSGKWLLIIECVRLLEHGRFLVDMFNLIMAHKKIFYNIDFLTAYNLKEESEIRRLTNQVTLFQVDDTYTAFIKDAMKFVSRWGYVRKISGETVGRKRHSARAALRVLRAMTPDVFIYVLFLVFVRNYDIVKKNTLGFLQIFLPDIQNIQTETSSPNSKRKVPVMPKFSASPYPKQVLETFAEQSKMH